MGDGPHPLLARLLRYRNAHVSIQCRLINIADRVASGQPGDMWFNNDMLNREHADYWKSHYLSNEYMSDWLGKRMPIFVVLPNGDWFCVDSRTRDGEETGQGWTVIGEPPRITVSPSIHVLEDDEQGNERTRWHGYLKDGVLE